MASLCVLIPTYSKTPDEVLRLCSDLGVTGHCIVSNQVQEDSDRRIADHIRLLCSSSKGVSANRNNLLGHLTSDIGLFIDDDCVLCPEYEQIIAQAFSDRPDAEAIVFSRASDDSVFAPVILPNKRARHFSIVSSMGAPGIAFRKEAVLRYRLRFNEKLGTPNYFFNGEDSVFLMDMINKGVRVYSSSIQIYILKNSSGTSSYFQGYDDHFFTSVGGIQFLLHRKLYPAYFFKQAFFYTKKTGTNVLQIIQMFYRGKQLMKEKVRSREICLWNEER